MESLPLMSTIVATLIVLFVLMMCRLWLRGYQYLTEKPIPHQFIPRGYTLSELAEYNGAIRPYVFIGIKGLIYNASMDWYGPDGPYHAFAACDCSRHLGKVVVGTEESNADWTTLSETHRATLNEWEESLKSKYPVVGWIIDTDNFVKRAQGLD